MESVTNAIYSSASYVYSFFPSWPGTPPKPPPEPPKVAMNPLLVVVPAIGAAHAIAFLLVLRWMFTRVKAGHEVNPLRPPIEKVIEASKISKTTSLQASVKVPRVPNSLNRLLVWMIYTRFGRWIFTPRLLKNNGLAMLEGVCIPEHMTFRPLVVPENRDGGEGRAAREALVQELMQEQLATAVPGQFRFRSVVDYQEAYSKGTVTPVGVAKAALAAIAESDGMNPPLKAFAQLDEKDVLDQARASTQRWKEGKPLSWLDGVVVALKEEYKWAPLAYRSGAMLESPNTEHVPNSALGRKLQELGAIVLGVTNMVEFGTSTVGSNPNALHGTPRNPYNLGHYTGGSSSGSAAAVAAGICVITLGTDGGGSVRLPAALCGNVGIKATYARLVDPGVKPISATVGHCGIHSNTVIDAVATYSVLAGKNSMFPESQVQPPITLRGIDSRDLGGIRLGIDLDYIANLSTKEVSDSVLDFVQTDLSAAGAEVHTIHIPELNETRLAHLATIASEMGCGLGYYVQEHFSQVNSEALTIIGTGMNLSSEIYLNAQRQRTRAMTILKTLFEEVDCIITPTSPIPAPRIPSDDGTYGNTNLDLAYKLSLYAFLGNLCGVPAITLPIAYNVDGLPVSMQIMGRWWEEHVIFKVAMVAERIVESKGGKLKPRLYYDLLQSAAM